MAGSLIITTFPPLFSCPQEKSHGGGLKWQISKYWCTCGWEFHLWVAVPHMLYNKLFPRLDHPGGQWTGCSLLNGTFLEAYRLGSEETPTVVGGNGNLSVSFLVLSVAPPFTSPLVLVSILQSSVSWKLLFVSLGFVIGIFVCDVVLVSYCSCESLQILWTQCSTEALNNKQVPIAWDSSFGLLSGILRAERKNKSLHFPLLCSCNVTSLRGS